MHVVGIARHVRAGLLMRPRIGVHPAACESFRHRRDVALAKRPRRLEHQALRFVERIRVGAGHERRIDVVVAHLASGDAEKARAQPEVAMQRWQTLVGLGDERVVDGTRQPLAVEGALERPRVLAHARVDRVLLQALVKGDAVAALELLPLAPERVEHALAIVAVGRFATLLVSGVVEQQFFAVGEPHLRPRHVRVREDLVHGASRAARQVEVGDQRLAARIERMRRHAHDVVQRVPVDAQPSLGGEELLESRPADAQELRPHERARLLALDAQPARLLVQLKALRHTGVLREELGGIDIEPLEALRRVGVALEAGFQARRRLAEMATARGDGFQLGAKRCRVVVPSFHRRIQVCQVPAILRFLGGGACRGERERDCNGFDHRSLILSELAPRTRIERATCPLGGGCSIH